MTYNEEFTAAVGFYGTPYVAAETLGLAIPAKALLNPVTPAVMLYQAVSIGLMSGLSYADLEQGFRHILQAFENAEIGEKVNGENRENGIHQTICD